MRKIIFFISSLIIYGFFYFGPQTISVYACNANATGEQGNCQAGFTCTGTAQAFTGNIVGGKCVANKPKPAQPNTCTANADYTKGSCQNGFVCTGTAENLTGN